MYVPKFVNWDTGLPTPMSVQAANITSYGAVGDGIHDDTAAIQACIDNNYSVFIPATDVYYRITSPILVPTSRKIWGVTPFRCRIVGDFNGEMFSLHNVNTYGMVFQDFALEQLTTQQGVGIFVVSALEETGHVYMKNMRFNNLSRGIDGSSTYSLFDSTYINCDFIGCNIGYNLQGSGNHFVGCYFRQNTWGVNFDNPSAVSIAGGTFTGCLWVLNTYDLVISTPLVRLSTFTGCWFEQCVTNVIGTTEAGTVTFQTFNFRGCLFQPSATAVLSGVMPTSAFAGLAGIVDFEKCVVYTDLNAAAALPTGSENSSTFFMRLDANIAINGAGTVTKKPTDGQILFPATQNPSTDVNCLDDYEEGSTTPTPTSTVGTFTTISCSVQYTKIGRIVHITGTVIITNFGTAAGGLRITMPFTSGVNASVHGRDISSTGVGLTGNISSGGTTIDLYNYNFTTCCNLNTSITFSLSYSV